MARMIASLPLAKESSLLERAGDLSPFFKRSLHAPIEGLDQSFSATEMQTFLAGCTVDDEDSLKRALRQLRKSVMLRLIARDLNGLADLAEVVETCTCLAEVTLNFAVNYLEPAQRQLYGIPTGESGAEQYFIVVGMGKLGGRELNVSSDIDLIFAYAEDGETSGESAISNHEFFSRLGKKLINAIHDKTEDGFVFRVDMALRPDGNSGPLVSSFAALEEYYQLQGREWERYAWIKGRVVVGEGVALEALLKPFVFRKYLDFGAFSAMREMKAQIHNEIETRNMTDNIKLGAGGIREIEFIAQVFQLLRGGQQPELQIRPTLQVLALLQSKKLLPAKTVLELRQAYVFLRNLEHRLQYLHDAQTQTLPGDDEDRVRIAKAMNFAGWKSFLRALNEHRNHVEYHFSQIFAEVQTPISTDTNWWVSVLETPGKAKRELSALGFGKDMVEHLHSMARSPQYRQLPPTSRARFDALIPLIVQESAKLEHKEAALVRVLELLRTICRRASYLALLVEYPQALQWLCQLCAASPWLAQYLTQHPILLDELLDQNTLHTAPDFVALRQELEKRLLACGDDVEQKLDVLRHFKHSQTFRFAAQDIAGKLAVETLSDYLSHLADMVLDAVLRHAWLGLKQAHIPIPKFSIIGYGKLGGRELGYASDLDIVFLYDDEAENAADIYARLAQRINHWLSSHTPAGLLYEADLALRPDGGSGLLVSSVQAFAEYQRSQAWVWEHQALSRARFCAGDANIGAAFEAIRHEIIGQERDLKKLRTEISSMRQQMLEAHPNDSGLFDLKHDRGGIIDVEFMVQFLVLAHAHQHAVLAGNVGNIALLKMAGELGLVSAGLAKSVADAYRVFRKKQHALRLQGDAYSRVKLSLVRSEVKKVRELWLKLFPSS
ncbi:MAG: bifunctional [glutamate--ammonia ligase]-adenylyl-L-tyrosine phosphorylase/[glutamate--ammonia-ligase] adenylyltransferase [Methylophilales bacterium]|nr:bifunctional [glutamate--ammonia ligase]-adenylyl-L-tyrosine phosphorylase/[glutamate--ammonia-ligase] adenylyltransferase [Methylophilales bacterium]